MAQHNVFEPDNSLIRLKNIQIIKDNNYTLFSYAKGGIDSSIGFYFKGTMIKIVADLSWNRSNNVLVKIDDNVINAARDLGANFWQTLFKIILPLSKPGIASGIIMGFVPLPPEPDPLPEPPEELEVNIST